jgi:hypothetical protein
MFREGSTDKERTPIAVDECEFRAACTAGDAVAGVG